MAVQLNSGLGVFLFDMKGNVGVFLEVNCKTRLLMTLNPVYVILDKHSKIITRLLCSCFACQAVVYVCVDVFVACSQILYFCNKIF